MHRLRAAAAEGVGARVVIDQRFVALHRDARAPRLRQADIGEVALAIFDLADESVLRLELRGQRGEKALPLVGIECCSIELIDRPKQRLDASLTNSGSIGDSSFIIARANTGNANLTNSGAIGAHSQVEAFAIAGNASLTNSG